MSQVDAVRRRLVDPVLIDKLRLAGRWKVYNQDIIERALVICARDVVIADKLLLEYMQQRARSMDISTRALEMLDYLARHAPSWLEQCRCNTCQPIKTEE